MRKFTINTPKLKTPLTVVYDAAGLLQHFDLTNTGMSAEQITTFKQMVPACLNDLETVFGKHKNVTVVETDYTVTFDMFWNAYGEKINRKRCEQLWAKLSKENQIKALQCITPYFKHLEASTYKRAKADPDTYLRNEYFLNEWK